MNIPAWKDKVLYAQLAFPLAFAGLPLYIHAPDFYATRYGIGLGFLGAALLLIRLFDAFSDPFIGRICDRFPQWRRVIIGIAAGMFAVSFGVLYTPPAALEMFWFVLNVFVATVSFSVLLINLNALGSAMGATVAEKTSLSAWREGFGVAGLICAITLPSVVGDMAFYALSCAVLMALSGYAFVSWLRRRAGETPSSTILPAPSLRICLTSPFASFFACYGLSMLASSLPAVLFVFFVRDWLGAGDSVTYFLLVYFGAGIVAIPLWRKLAALWGNDRLWIVAMAISAASISLAALTVPGDRHLFTLVCAASGAAFGGELFLAPAILAARMTNADLGRHASFFYGVYAFFMKFSLAFATVIAFLALEISGFTPAGSNSVTPLYTLVGLYAVLPAIIKALTAAAFYKWRNYEKKNRDLFNGSHHVS